MHVLLPILAILGFTSAKSADVTLAPVQPQSSGPKIITVQLAHKSIDVHRLALGLRSANAL